MFDKYAEELFEKLDEVSPEGYNFAFHIRYSRPSFIRLTYRTEWSEVYSAKKLILNDPAVVWPLMNDGACRWSEINLPDPLGVFPEAARFGYNYGVAIGCGDLESRSLGSCSRGDREFSDDEIADIVEIIDTLHVLLERKSELKSKQKEALRLFDAGLTYDAICEELNISKTALRNRLVRARVALGASTNHEAAKIALDRGLFKSTRYTGITKGLPAGRDKAG